ncbi:hypothetical protein O6H91_Y509700 [Diphasiastrum complanatum]|nr:hypothetical protein O6H91_Y509700 [Diphasiastrum complanatum]
MGGSGLSSSLIKENIMDVARKHSFALKDKETLEEIKRTVTEDQWEITSGEQSSQEYAGESIIGKSYAVHNNVTLKRPDSAEGEQRVSFLIILLLSALTGNHIASIIHSAKNIRIACMES